MDGQTDIMNKKRAHMTFHKHLTISDLNSSDLKKKANR